MFAPLSVRESLGDRAFTQDMLDTEAALAVTQEALGLIPPGSGEAVAQWCAVAHFDVSELGTAAAVAGNPVIAVVAALRALVPGDVAGYVHRGATSQDIIDTAMMLSVRRGLGMVGTELDAVTAHCAELAEVHARTVMAGRTLLQHAVPTTFGLKAAGWLAGLDDARRDLHRLSTTRLAVQLGGAAGTLSVFGDRGVEVLEGLADRLGLLAPALPWHTSRGRFAEVASALGVATGAMAKVALDVALLMQTEVGEVAEGAVAGRGGSSAMPHKRNPAGSTLVLAADRRVRAAAGVVAAGMAQEHERAVGAWHAEWQPLREALVGSAGAAHHLRGVVADLEVDADRMRANLDRFGGLVMTEQLMWELEPRMGLSGARQAVEDASRRVDIEDRPLVSIVGDSPMIVDALSPLAVSLVLDPGRSLLGVPALIDRALAAYRRPLGVTR